ncbi:MAG TPA: zinc-binding dehydrogenase, partial [Thermoanaerobaculia bacterium]|nr:zinc-binding dehydrogenase [Thermoanaerobaculia bacterium]
VPLAALTALQALRDLGDLQPGEHLAVTGAAGGVGHFAVQLAAALGARVTAVAGPGHQDFVRRLGAHRAVDYTREDFTAIENEDAAGDARATEERGTDAASYEVIFDAAGAYRFGACEPALTAGGVYVTTRPGPAIFVALIRAALSRLVDRRDARRAAVAHTRPRGEDLAALADLIAAGRLHPAIDRVYALDEVRDAHASSQAGHPQGKIVLRVAGDATPATT